MATCFNALIINSSNGTSVVVGDALKLPELRRGVPEVLVHEAGLGAEIRWVHAGEAPDIASMLKGGELLLTTGMGIGHSAAAQRRLVEELVERRIAALVLELGTSFREVPDGLVRAAKDRGLCLIVLHRQVRFVEVTEAIHRLLIDQGGEMLRSADQLHRRFTALMLGGAGVPEILTELSRFVQNPVFLERSGQGLAYHASYEGDDETVLGAWSAFTRGLATAPASVEERVPLGGEESWGRVVTLALDGPLRTEDRVAVERAVGLIALALMRTEEVEQLGTRERGNFLAGLTRSRAAEAEIAARAAELGFAESWEALLPLAAAVDAGRVHDDAAWVAVKRDLQQGLERERLAAIIGDGEAREILIVVGLRRVADRPRIAALVGDLLRQATARRFEEVPAPTLCAAASTTHWVDVGASLAAAAASLEAAAHEPHRPWHDLAVPSPDRLLFALRTSKDLRQFTEERLRPLLDADRRGRGDLIETLGTLCDNAGRKRETAEKLGIKRQTLYHRLNRIETATGSDLSDGDVLLSFHIALRARRFLELR
jgi:purine catabolism regulator